MGDLGPLEQEDHRPGTAGASLLLQLTLLRNESLDTPRVRWRVKRVEAG